MPHRLNRRASPVNEGDLPAPPGKARLGLSLGASAFALLVCAYFLWDLRPAIRSWWLSSPKPVELGAPGRSHVDPPSIPEYSRAFKQLEERGEAEPRGGHLFVLLDDERPRTGWSVPLRAAGLLALMLVNVTALARFSARSRRAATARAEGSGNRCRSGGSSRDIRVFNTMTGNKEPLVPLERGAVGMYVCGPTVYDMSHVGHARVYVMFDSSPASCASRGSRSGTFATSPTSTTRSFGARKS